LRAGDLADRATFYRHDLAFAENPQLPTNPHGFLATLDIPGFRAITQGAQEQIATFFATDGTAVLHPEPARFFETPISLPLPEHLNYILPPGPTGNPAKIESVVVNLTSADGATIADGQGVGTIVNDDVALPTISISDAWVVEGNSGASQMMFMVSLSQASTQEVRVNFATANGTAKTGNLDYAAQSGTLRFAAGETSRTITVLIIGDKKKESDEYFLVSLFAAANGTSADGQGVGTILNDDGGSGKSYAAAFDAALEEMLNDHNKKRVR
jgi:hypothetical protein